MMKMIFTLLTFCALSRAASFDPNQNLFFYDSAMTIIVYSGKTDCSSLNARCTVDITDSVGRTESVSIVGSAGDVLTAKYNFPRTQLPGPALKAYLTFWGGAPYERIVKAVDMGFKDVKPPTALKPATRPAKPLARAPFRYRLDGKVMP
jgi:hypothetical protein